MQADYNVSTMGGVRFYNVSVMDGVCFSLLCKSEITRCGYCDLRRGWRGTRMVVGDGPTWIGLLAVGKLENEDLEQC
jgi:hypothetical protein